MPSEPAEARVRPSGAKATENTVPPWPVSVAEGAGAEGARAEVSHSRTVPSEPAEARVRPSGAKATENTVSLCPANVATTRRSATSHSRTA